MSFNGELKIFPVTLLRERPKTDYETGGKVVLPSSILERMTNRFTNIEGAMFFKLINPNNHFFTHCGVMEFTAEEGHINAPSWVMDQLDVKCSDDIVIESTTLPVATYCRFQPQIMEFLDISNPKAVLENYFRNFPCLTQGDIIPIHYNNKVYPIKVEEARPMSAVSIIECDMEVDFAPPPGYEEPKREEQEPQEEEEEVDQFQPFCGIGVRLDGKVKKQKVDPAPLKSYVKVQSRGIPDYDYQIGTITFFRKNLQEKPINCSNKDKKEFEAFTGQGNTCDDD